MSDHPIEWLTPEGAPAPDRGKKSVESTVSHLDAVKGAVYGKALGMAREASANLRGHRLQGHARVEVDRHPRYSADTPDWYIYLRDEDPGGEGKGGGNMTDRSAMSIEFGWMPKGRKKGKGKVKGLHILGNVMNRAARRYRGG